MTREASVVNAKPDKLFYVVVNVVLVNVVDRTCLLLKRGDEEKEAASKWAFPGGKAEHQQIINGRISNFFGVVALGECLQESGLSFDSDTAQLIANGAFVREDGIPVVWATVAAPYIGGEVSLEKGSFTEHGWFKEETLPPDTECIGSVKQEAVQALDLLCSN